MILSEIGIFRQLPPVRIYSGANRCLTQLSGRDRPAENPNTTKASPGGKILRVREMKNIATPHPQPTQRRILSHGNIGRQLIDQQRAAQYIPTQKMRGKANIAQPNSILATLEGSMLIPVRSEARTVYSIDCRKQAIALKFPDGWGFERYGDFAPVMPSRSPIERKCEPEQKCERPSARSLCRASATSDRGIERAQSLVPIGPRWL